MSKRVAVSVLVVPVFKRYWLWHAWKEAPPSTAPAKPWQQGSSLQEKAQLLLSSIQRWGSRVGEKQWHKLATAEQGTFNHRLFRLAQDVLSRVDPNESFLKVLPQQADLLQFSYPASLPERLVRRRLRLLASRAQPFHSSRLRLWAIALVPQLPLIPLPLPNVTIYFTIWRIISNRSASTGAGALMDALDRLSDVQRLKLAQQLVSLSQTGGVVLREGSWAAQLAADVTRLQQQCQGPLYQTAPQEGSSSSSMSAPGTLQHQQHSQQQQQQPVRGIKGLPLPSFVGDKELERLVEPQQRWKEFLPEATAEELARIYDQPHLMEHYRAARKTCERKGKAPY